MKEYDNKNQGAIWLRTAKSGLKYMSGEVNVNGTDYDIAMFKNDKKGNDKAPDYRLKISDKKEREEIKQEETKQVETRDPFKEFAEENPNIDLPF